MEFQLAPRETVWRERGRPPRSADPQLMILLQRTSPTTAGVVRLDPDTPLTEVVELESALRTCARALGRAVHIQRDPTQVAFYLEDPT
jgi:hypothetical protein